MTNANATGTPGHASAKKRFGIKARTETPVRQARPRPRLAVTVLGTMDLEELLNGDQLTVPMAPERELLAIETPAPVVAPIEIAQHLAAVDFTRPWVEVDEATTGVSAPEAVATDAPASNPFPDVSAIVAAEPAKPAPPATPPVTRARRKTTTPQITRTLDDDLQDLLGENPETAPTTPTPKRRGPRRTPDADATVPTPAPAIPAATEATSAPATPVDSTPVAWETPTPWDAPAAATTTASPRATASRRARRAKVTPDPAPPITDAVADAPLPLDAEAAPVPAPGAVAGTPKPRAKPRRAKTPRLTPVDAPAQPAPAPDAITETRQPRAKSRRAKTPPVTSREASTPTIDTVTEAAILAIRDGSVVEPATPLESAPAVAAEPAVEAIPVTEELPFAPLPASDPPPARRRRSARPAIERVDAEAAPVVASMMSVPVAEPGWPMFGELAPQPAVSEPSPRGATYTIGLRVGIPPITPDPGFTPYQPVYEGSPHRGSEDHADTFVGGPQTLRREALARAVQEALDGV